jgi:hypothetical protein
MLGNICIDSKGNLAFKTASELFNEAEIQAKGRKIVAFELRNISEAIFIIGEYRKVKCLGSDGHETYLVFEYINQQWKFKGEEDGPLYCLG